MAEGQIENCMVSIARKGRPETRIVCVSIDGRLQLRAEATLSHPLPLDEPAPHTAASPGSPQLAALLLLVQGPNSTPHCAGTALWLQTPDPGWVRGDSDWLSPW